MPRNNKRKKRRQRNADQTQSRAHPSKRAEEKSEHLVYEDMFDDTYEKEMIVDAKRSVHFSEEVDVQEKEKEGKQVQQRVWQPTDGLGESVQLDYDATAYTAFHQLRMDWPCLSFDVLPDGLGQHRVKYPHTVYLVAGTQADRANRNSVKLFKFSELHKTKHDDESDADSDDDPDDLDDDPILEEKLFQHPGGINRLRCMPQQPSIIATHADTKQVHLWDAKLQLSALDRPPTMRIPPLRPTFSFEGHSDEGFSMDWNPVFAGRLLTGDCANNIYLWNPSNGTWQVDAGAYQSHTSSVEDLQWSPTEATVFASCSADNTIRIWDTRAKNRSMLTVEGHTMDVNVISWNKKQAHLLVSGADDGSVKVWDMRAFSADTPAAHFKWHNQPITSVQWHPTDESVFAASCADDSISFWDMGLEEDNDLPAEGADIRDLEIPSQLLFIHRGQTQIKEVHWHKQIPGMLISTAQSGFNFLHPANLQSLEEEHFEGKFIEKEGEAMVE